MNGFALSDVASVLLVALIVGLIVCIGGVPGHIATKRNHPNASAIKVCGWLGWLFTGGLLWVVALVWAYTNTQTVSRASGSALFQDDAPTWRCPYCAELIKEDAVICRFCNRDVSPAAILRDKAGAVDDELSDSFNADAHRKTKWRIVGTLNGKSVNATATASSAAEACRMAEAKGIVVADVTEA